jgi:hypothetical protein
MGLYIEQIENWDQGTQMFGHPRGPWSQTVSGHKYHPQNPDPAAIKLYDIAHQLSLVNRFGGATKHPYSVAQHTLLVHALVKHLFPGSLRRSRWALLHDAAEYVLGDMVRPVKTQLASYRAFEDLLMACIIAKYNLEPLSPHEKADLKYADNLACVIEKVHLLPNACYWPGMPTYIDGFEHYTRERDWRDVRFDLQLALTTEFGPDA